MINPADGLSQELSNKVWDNNKHLIPDYYFKEGEDMGIKVAFYKGKGSFFDKLIRWWTKSNYSHCELVIHNMWYSSSPRDGRVRSTYMNYNPRHWDFIEIETTGSQTRIVMDSINQELGKRYDWIGIVLSQILPLGIENRSKWFCSEICSYALQRAGIIDNNDKPSWFSPERLYRKCKALKVK